MTNKNNQKSKEKDINPTKNYLKEIEEISATPLSPKKEKELFKKIGKGDDGEAKKKIITANLKLVVPIAKKYAKRYPDLSLLDLIQKGNLGLLKAVDRFNYRENKNIKFSDYATWWIRQAITRSIYLSQLSKMKKEGMEKISIKTKKREKEQSKELKKYLEKIKKIPLLTYDEERKLWEEISEGNIDAKRKIFEAYLWLVAKVIKDIVERTARNYPYMTPLELIREGEKGLLEAIDSHSPKNKEEVDPYLFRQMYVKEWIASKARMSLYNKIGFDPYAI